MLLVMLISLVIMLIFLWKCCGINWNIVLLLVLRLSMVIMNRLRVVIVLDKWKLIVVM